MSAFFQIVSAAYMLLLSFSGVGLCYNRCNKKLSEVNVCDNIFIYPSSNSNVLRLCLKMGVEHGK